MECIAGIVAIDDVQPVDVGLLRAMIRSIDPGASPAIWAAPEGFAAVATVGGADAPASGDDAATARAFCIGELHGPQPLPADGLARELLDRYRRDSAGLAAGLGGAFAAVVVDGARRCALLITDQVSSVPLFHASADGTLFFASEVRGLLPALPAVRPDPSSVLSLLVRGWFANRRTLVEGVSQLDYATVCRIGDGRVSHRPYWRFRLERSGSPARPGVFAPLLRQAVRRHAQEPSLAILLSGGVDSRGLLACLEDCAAPRVIVYTGRTRESRMPTGDWAVAERVAREAGLAAEVFHYEPSRFLQAMRHSIALSDGAAGFVFEDVWDRIRQSVGGVPILLGDECMGLPYRGVLGAGDEFLRIGLTPLDHEPILSACVRGDRLREFEARSRADLEAVGADLPPGHRHDRSEELYFAQRLIHMLNPKRRLIGHAGLRVRRPWLDLALLDHVRALGRGDRQGKACFREALARIGPALFALPLSTDSTSETINYRGHIRRAEQRDGAVSEQLLGGSPWFADYFDRDAVLGLLTDVCREEPPAPVVPPEPPPRTLRAKLVMRARIMARRRRRYHRPPLSPTAALLAILRTSMALEHLHAHATATAAAR